MHLLSAARAVLAEVLSPNTKINSSINASAESNGGMMYVKALRFAY